MISNKQKPTLLSFSLAETDYIKEKKLYHTECKIIHIIKTATKS